MSSESETRTEALLQIGGIPIKYFVLLLLVGQNATAVLMMRYVRSIAGETNFETQTAVIMQELFKGLACVCVLLASEGSIRTVWAVPSEALKTSVPALVYLVQEGGCLQRVSAKQAGSQTK